MDIRLTYLEKENYFYKYYIDFDIDYNTNIKALDDESSRKLWRYIFRCESVSQLFNDGSWYKDANLCGVNVNMNVSFSERRELAQALDREIYIEKSEFVYFIVSPWESFEMSWRDFLHDSVIFYKYASEGWLFCPSIQTLLLMTPLGKPRKKKWPQNI